MRFLLILSFLLSGSFSFAGTTNVDSLGVTPLMKASALGQKKLVSQLLKNTKLKLDEKDKEDQTALFYAMDNDQEEIALQLIDAGADLSLTFNDIDESYLALAIRYNLSKVVEKIVMKKPELVNDADALGFTPLMRSVRSSPKATIEFLLKHGAKKDLKNAEGQTALDIARKAQNQEAIALLSTK